MDFDWNELSDLISLELCFMVLLLCILICLNMYNINKHKHIAMKEDKMSRSLFFRRLIKLIAREMPGNAFEIFLTFRSVP